MRTLLQNIQRPARELSNSFQKEAFLINTRKTSNVILASILMLFLLGSFTSCGGEQTTSSSSTSNGVTAEGKPEKPLGHLVERYLKAYPDELTGISDLARIPEIGKAMEAYNNKRYEEAIDLFPNFALNQEQAGYIHLYKGISQLMVDREYDAFTTFQLINSSMGKAMEISNWYLILNYVGFNNVFEARRKLEVLLAAGAYPGETARELLNDLPEN